jgi:hypothetical protein
MPVMAIRTYDPWTFTSALGVIVLLGLVATVLILASRRGNR